MAVITEAAVRELAGFRGQGAPVTTCYLDVDGRRLSRHRDYEQELERIIRSARVRANGNASVGRDLQRIEDYVKGGFDRSRTRGLAIFSCSERGLLAGVAAAGPGAQPGHRQPGAGRVPARVADPGVRPLRRAARRQAAGPHARVPLRRARRPLRPARRAAPGLRQPRPFGPGRRAAATSTRWPPPTSATRPTSPSRSSRTSPSSTSRSAPPGRSPARSRPASTRTSAIACAAASPSA